MTDGEYSQINRGEFGMDRLIPVYVQVRIRVGSRLNGIGGLRESNTLDNVLGVHRFSQYEWENLQDNPHLKHFY